MDSGEIEQLVNELETRVDRLRSLYEQYFMGIEKIIPAVPHKDVDRRIHILRKEQIRNTAVRFRFQMIIQRYNTYQTHWQRICRQIEEGTYKRHRLTAERKFKAAEREAEPEPVPESVEVIAAEPPTKPVQIVPMLSLDDVGDLDAILKEPAKPPAKKPPPLPPRAAPPAPPAPQAAPPAPVAIAKPARPAWRKVGDKPAPAPAAVVAAPAPAPAPKPEAPAPAPKVAAAPAPAAPAAAKSSPADLPDTRLRQIYAQYVQTRRAQNESTASLTYDAMAKSLRESSAKLREKHGKSVDFEVAVKDGKTILKPVVKKTAQ